MIEIACPSCAKRFMTEDRFSGRTAHCPKCGTPIPIPRAAAPSSSPAQPAASQPTAPSTSPTGPRPAKLKTAGILSLIGGIWAVCAAVIAIVVFAIGALATFGLGLLAGIYLVPFILYTLSMGIVAIINGAMVLAGKIRRGGLPMTAAIMQIVNVIFCDIINLVLGIISLTMLRSPEVKTFFRR